MIKDSGDRTKFSTGAVRDMHEGKGRFDLLPWNAIHDIAIHCEEGAKKYGERNVDMGMPQHSLIDSALRHLSKYIRNQNDEPHLRAACWNLLWALEQETTHKELNDLPGRRSKSRVDILKDTDCIDEFLGRLMRECKRSVKDIDMAVEAFVNDINAYGDMSVSDYIVMVLGFSIRNPMVDRIMKELSIDPFTLDSYGWKKDVNLCFEVDFECGSDPIVTYSKIVEIL